MRWYRISIAIERQVGDVMATDVINMDSIEPVQWQCAFDASGQTLWFFKRMISLYRQFIRKNADYATDLSNWYEGFMESGLQGIYNRTTDKMNRIKNHLRGQKLHNESFSDSCGDAATYLLMLDEANNEDVPIQGTNWS